MENILLLTDFSKNANNAIDYAMQFFKGSSKNFFILNVQKISGYTTGHLMTAEVGSSSIYESIISPNKSKITELIKRLSSTHSEESYAFEGVCDYDAFLASINQVIKSKSIDLIVMGTNGATGAAEVIFGSNTLQVIRHIDLPILVIPENYKFAIIKKILLASEYDESFNADIIKPMLSILKNHEAELEILFLDNGEHLSEVKRKRKQMKEVLTKVTKHFHLINNVPADIAIECTTQLQQIDLTAKIINKESFFKRQMSRSSLDEITYRSKIPLFFMHP